MVNYPEAQRSAQEELDRVLQGRLPQLGDEADLPYTTALAKEIMRWQTVTPLGTLLSSVMLPHSTGHIGVPHLVTEDDVYKGYRIPKNSIVIANAWLVFQRSTIIGDLISANLFPFYLFYVSSE